MFLDHIEPFLQKGIKFELSIALSDDKKIRLSVNPVCAGDTSMVLPWKEFTGTAQEFNSIGGITGVMQSFTATTKSLLDQLEDARLVAAAVAEQAAKDATAAPKVEKPKSKPSQAKAVPPGLLGEDEDGKAEDDGGPAPADASLTEAVAPQNAPQLAFTL